MYDVLIIGCGIAGAATAFELSKYRLRVAVLEQENDVSVGTTKANSAILHAGYDPMPGSLMARLNVRGSMLAKELCRALDVPYKQTGSLVVGFSQEENATLEELYHRGVQNGVPELRLLTGDEARALEPGLSQAVAGALLAPSAAIVSPWEYCLALAETAVENGAELFLETQVTGLTRAGDGWQVETSRGAFQARYVVNAAGVLADRVHDLAAPHAFDIRPVRGQYYLLDKSEGSRVGRVIFQCPSKAGKGILVAPTVHGNLIVGPDAVDTAPDDTATSADGLTYVRDTARRSVPNVDVRASIRNFAGVRANTAVHDFHIGMAQGVEGFLDLAGICSPGLTAAPAIAEYAAELLEGAGLALAPKDDFVSARRRVRFSELPSQERAELVAREPAYGRVICRCETVTEGEILAALKGPIPPVSVDGVKRRVNAGMGRCQGGFCGPRVVELLCRELGLSPDRVVQDRAGTQMLLRQTKGGTDHV